MIRENTPLIMLWTIIISMITINNVNGNNLTKVSYKNIFIEYRLTGGIPGDGRVDEILLLNDQGIGKFKCLNEEFEFSIEKNEAKNIINAAIELIVKNKEQKLYLEPDSTTSSIKIYKNNISKEMFYYSDIYLEKKYPELRRPMKYIELEKTIRSIIKRKQLEQRGRIKIKQNGEDWAEER